MEKRMSIWGVGPLVVISGLAVALCAYAVGALVPGLTAVIVVPAVLKWLGAGWGVIGLYFWIASAFMVTRDVPKGKLMTTGVFALCRNPMYAAFIIFILPALALLTGIWAFAAAAVVMAAVFPRLIRTEEAALEKLFGEAYRDYVRKTPRLVPLRHTLLVLTGFLFLWPKDAFANAGTPLMWASMLHLVFGNAVIGVIEGTLIAGFFSVRKMRAIWIMILANYVSMIAGLFVMAGVSRRVSQATTIYSVHNAIFLTGLLAFILTILIEWPFCFWVLNGKDAKRKGSLKASVCAQTLSYALLIPFYFMASGTSLLWTVKPERSLAFVKSDPWVYYIPADRTSVMRVRVRDGKAQKVMDAAIKSDYARLYAARSPEGTWDLWVKDRTAGGRKDVPRLLVRNFAVRADVLKNWEGKPYGEEPDSWFNFGTVDLRASGEGEWEAHTGFWAVEGFNAKNNKTGRSIHFSLETPFIQWYIRNVSVLPGDQFIFQVGEQVVLFDPVTLKMGLITKGRGPVVAYQE